MKSLYLKICFALVVFFTLFSTSTLTTNSVTASESTATPTLSTPPRRFLTVEIAAPSLANNLIGEPTQRKLNIYLPPSYYTSDKHYPVIYYLPGFGDALIKGITLPTEVDDLITSGTIQETLIVTVSGRNTLNGSFFVNSPVTGNWEDFVVTDVVNYVDANYRTLAKAESRGITGHSMGGFGALNIAMHHPDVFSAVYGLSPGLFDENGLTESPMFSSPAVINSFLRTQEKLAGLSTDAAIAAMESSVDFTIAYGAAFVPAPNNKPPYFDFPYLKPNSEPDPEIWKRWDQGFGDLKAKIQTYKANLLSLKGLGIDYGLNDEFHWIANGCAYFAEQLEAAGIPHVLATFEGDHASKLGSRILEHMLPFFSKLLRYD